MQVWKTWREEPYIVGELISNINGAVTALTLDGKKVYMTAVSCHITEPKSGWYFGENGKRYIYIPSSNG